MSWNSLRTPQAFPPSIQRERLAEQETARTVDKGHGRLETRTITTTPSLNNHIRWPGLKQVCRIVRERTTNGQRTVETAYYITSVSRTKGGNARTLLDLARGHWGAIENGLHYVRDMAFDEDRCTIFRGHAAENLAAFRNAAINWLRSNGIENITAKMRSFARNSQRLFSAIGIVK